MSQALRGGDDVKVSASLGLKMTLIDCRPVLSPFLQHHVFRISDNMDGAFELNARKVFALGLRELLKTRNELVQAEKRTSRL